MGVYGTVLRERWQHSHILNARMFSKVAQVIMDWIFAVFGKKKRGGQPCTTQQLGFVSPEGRSVE